MNIIDSIKTKFKTKQFTARDAYMTAKYGVVQDTEKLLDNFFKTTEELIKHKSQSGKYCAMAEIDVDLKQYTEEIINCYKNAGFQVFKFSENTNIDGERIQNITSVFIILMWNNLTPEQKIEMTKVA